MNDFFEVLVAILIIITLAFLICRALVLWYWKVNVIVSNLEALNHNLEEIKALLINQNSITSKASKSKEEEKLPEL